MGSLNILGMDYGASNGRGFVGTFNDGRLSLREINRFSNIPMPFLSGIYWDIFALYRGLRNSMHNAKEMSIPISSVGVDSWAQDFGIIDRQGNLLGLPHSYRDPRRISGFKRIINQYSEYELFKISGLIPSEICTLFQLASMVNKEEAALKCGYKLLFIPSLLSYFLTGKINCDSTLASMSLMYNIQENRWQKELLMNLSLPDLLPEVIEHSRIAGRITDQELNEAGFGDVPVIMVPQHDTALAFTTITAYGQMETAYISCGTMGIVGAPTSEPIINKKVFDSGFCNELGHRNQNYLVKNGAGLWVLQECIKEWEYRGYVVDYAYLDKFTQNNPPKLLINIDDKLFMQPGNMNNRVADYFNRWGQAPPKNEEELYSCIIHSLANRLSKNIVQMEDLMGKKYKNIHIVGGGSKNKALCKIIKQNTGKHVIAGPHEASVIGNILAQLIYWNEIKDIIEMKDIVSLSFPIESF